MTHTGVHCHWRNIMATLLRMLRLQLLMLHLTAGFFIPTALRKGEHTNVNDKIVSCASCNSECNKANISSGPWRCPYCKKRGDIKE